MPIIAGWMRQQEEAQKINAETQRFAKELQLAKDSKDIRAQRRFLATGSEGNVWLDPNAKSDEEVQAKLAELSAPGFLDELGPGLLPMSEMSPRKDTLSKVAEIGTGLGLLAGPGPAKAAGISLLADAPFATSKSLLSDAAGAGVNAITGGIPFMNSGGVLRQIAQSGLSGGADMAARNVADKMSGAEDRGFLADAGKGVAMGAGGGAMGEVLRSLVKRMNPALGAAMNFLRQPTFKVGNKEYAQAELVQAMKENPEFAEQVNRALGIENAAYNTGSPKEFIPERMANEMRDLKIAQTRPILMQPTRKIPRRDVEGLNVGFTPININPGQEEITEEMISRAARPEMDPIDITNFRTPYSRMLEKSGLKGDQIDKFYTKLSDLADAGDRDALQSLVILDYMNDLEAGGKKGAEVLQDILQKSGLLKNKKNIGSRVRNSTEYQNALETLQGFGMSDTTAAHILDAGIAFERQPGRLQRLTELVTKEDKPRLREILEESRGEVEQTTRNVLQEEIPGSVTFDLAKSRAMEEKLAPKRMAAEAKYKHAEAAEDQRFAQQSERYAQQLAKQAAKEANTQVALPGVREFSDMFFKDVDTTVPMRTWNNLLAGANPEEAKKLRATVLMDMLARFRENPKARETFVRKMESISSPAAGERGGSVLDQITGDPNLSANLLKLLKNESKLRDVATGEAVEEVAQRFSLPVGRGVRVGLSAGNRGGPADPSGFVERMLMPSASEGAGVAKLINETLPMANAAQRAALSQSAQAPGVEQQLSIGTVIELLRRKLGI